jgi:hypothetical protein
VEHNLKDSLLQDSQFHSHLSKQLHHKWMRMINMRKRL